MRAAGTPWETLQEPIDAVYVTSRHSLFILPGGIKPGATQDAPGVSVSWRGGAERCGAYFFKK